MFRIRPFFLFCFGCCVISLNCKYKNDIESSKTKVLVKIQAAYHQKIYLHKVPFNNEHFINLDSAVIQSGLDSFIFYLPSGEERLYTINVAESNIRIPFINDSKYIEIYYNHATHKYSIQHSAASEELKAFEDEQLNLAKNMRTLKFRIDSLKIKHTNYYLIKDSIAKLNSINADFFKRYKNFADTVHSPAAFMAVYDDIDFGNNRTALKTFIIESAKRFPHHSGVQTLAKNVSDYLKIFDEQYKVGDTLPEVVLPDEYGVNFSTYSLKGKYVLINIWSTLCDDCIKYSEAIKKVKQQFPDKKFEAINIAVDDEKQAWLYKIKELNYNWPQLIDVNMWNGIAFKTLKFDSIPYNFLISPQGILIAKAIKRDSLSIVLKKTLR